MSGFPLLRLMVVLTPGAGGGGGAMGGGGAGGGGGGGTANPEETVSDEDDVTESPGPSLPEKPLSRINVITAFFHYVTRFH